MLASRLKKAGIKAFLTKPLAFHELAVTVRSVLDRKQESPVTQ